MKFSALFSLLLVFGITVPAMGADNSGRLGNIDPNYDAEQAIRRGGDERRAKAKEAFDDGPRESTLRLTLAPSLIFGLHSNLSGGDGRGINAAILVQANSDTPDFKFLIGGEMLAFSANASRNGERTELTTANLMLSAGFAYDFTPNFALGALWGYGLIGASQIEKDFADGSSDTSGTMNTVLSFKPYAEFMLNKNFSVYAAYRFLYVGNSLLSTAVNWGEIETAAHAVEFGCCYRF